MKTKLLLFLLTLLFSSSVTFAKESKVQEAVDLYEKALELLNAEEFASAIPVLSDVIRMSPANSDLKHLALSHRGTCYYELNQFFLAINDFNGALFVNVTETHYHNPATTDFLTNYINGINFYLSGSAKRETGSLRAACIDWRRAERLGESRAMKLIKKHCAQ